MIVYITDFCRAGCPQPAGHPQDAIARKGNNLLQENAYRRCDAYCKRRLEGKPPYRE